MNKLSFRSQFILALTATLLLSIICTAIVWAGSLYLLSDDSFLRPANYYEKKINDIVPFVDQHGDELLSPEFRDELEQIIPLEGLDYQVYDLSGQFIYGSQPAEPLEDIIRKLNTSGEENGRFVRYVPVMNSTHELTGVFVLKYYLNLVSSNQPKRAVVVLFIIGNMAAPFLFILLFTMVFARKIGKRLEPPIARLINGAGRIQKNDLDFAFSEAGGSKELAQLTSAFEEMRGALQASLTAQWQMDQERRDMAAAVAHDLRTPLTIIQGHVDNLLDAKDKQPERLDKYLQTIRKNTDRAVRLLDDMHLVSEIDQPGFTLQVSTHDFAAFCREKAEEYRLNCAAKHIAFRPHINIADGHNGRINADIHRLEQITDNLTANSIRFTPEGGQIIWDIKIGPEKAVLETADSGPGFTKADLVHMFEKFYQGDRSRSTTKGHAGLGLYIVKTLAEKHGGTVAAGNRPQGGAYVNVTLPLTPKPVFTDRGEGKISDCPPQPFQRTDLKAPQP